MINLQSLWPPPVLNSYYTHSLCLSLFSKFFLYPPLHSPPLLGFKLLESRKQLHTSSHSFNIMLNPSTPNTQWLADFFKVPVLSSSLPWTAKFLKRAAPSHCICCLSSHSLLTPLPSVNLDDQWAPLSVNQNCSFKITSGLHLAKSKHQFSTFLLLETTTQSLHLPSFSSFFI